jgi:hypothetical protein
MFIMNFRRLSNVHRDVRNSQGGSRAAKSWRSVRLSAIFFKALMFLVAWPAFAASEWIDWRRSGDLHNYFPAFVGSIAWPNGETLNDDNCLTWQRWRMCFGHSKPIADLKEENNIRNISIPLRCGHQVVGDYLCTLILQRNWFTDSQDVYTTDECRLSIKYNSTSMKIGCPKTLLLLYEK